VFFLLLQLDLLISSIKEKKKDDPLHYQNDLEEYFDGGYLPSIENIVIFNDENPYNRIIQNSLTAFIGSWMLSSLVRYAPMKWQEILAGQENDLIKHIREFRDERLLLAFESFLPYHVRMSR